MANSQFLDKVKQKGETSKETGASRRLFPFHSTPSGNLKVVPQQVVFESQKVSVIVANPNSTRVNVKAEVPDEAYQPVYQTFNMEEDKSKSAQKNPFFNTMALMGGGSFEHMMPPGMMPPPLVYPNPIKKRGVSSEDVDEDDDDVSDTRSTSTNDQLDLKLSKMGYTDSTPIDWNEVKLPYKTNLYKFMHYRITNYINPDCVVQIDDVQFNCHLLVLQCYSTYFNEINSRDVVKLPSQNVTPRAFELIYEWMTYVHGDSYTILKRDNILQVFIAAQFLGIKELEEQCWSFIDSEALFTEDTAFLLYLDAKKLGIKTVMELMIPRIKKFFLILVSSTDFLELEVDEVVVFLSSNYICIHSEIEVFMSAVRWLFHDWEFRQNYVQTVMECVRFGLIAPWQLVDIRRNPENPEFLQITACPHVQSMIDNGLAFAIIKYWYSHETDNYYHWIELLGLTEPPNRNWAEEERNYVKYREFLHDLRGYRKQATETGQKIKNKKISNFEQGMMSSPRTSLHEQERKQDGSKTKQNSAILDSVLRQDIVSDADPV